MDLSSVWQFAVWGLSIGLVLGGVFYFFGVWSAIWLRWFESMVGERS